MNNDKVVQYILDTQANQNNAIVLFTHKCPGETGSL